MRVKAAQVALLLLCAATSLFAHEELDALKDHAIKENEPRLYAQVVRREIEVANGFYNTGDVDKAQVAIDELVSFTDKCVAAAQAKRSHLKDTELELSKASKRLDDIRKSLNFDDQPPVKAAVQKIEDARRTLLTLMFQDPDKAKHEEKKP
jgi:hypothetical protein